MGELGEIEGVSGKRGQVPFYHVVDIKQNFGGIIKLLWL